MSDQEPTISTGKPRWLTQQAHLAPNPPVAAIPVPKAIFIGQTRVGEQLPLNLDLGLFPIFPGGGCPATNWGLSDFRGGVAHHLLDVFTYPGEAGRFVDTAKE